MTGLASAAFRLALKGLYVFPLTPGTKIPMKGTHGYRDATREVDVVRAWWAKWPMSNIAVATGKASRVWVLDIDPRHGGTMAITELEAEHGALPATITASTPRGGRHLYWRWPDDGPEIRNSVARVGDGIDVLAEGGQIVLPPSVLANGRRYRWVRNGASTFADAPGWLVALALPPPLPPRPEPKPLNGDVGCYVATAAASELTELENAAKGTRNDALNRAAFNLAQFVKAGALPAGWVQEQLETRAIGLGLPVIEARGTINSAFRAAQARDLPR
ncbi:MAG: bifunctional DNA primase/polymerase [Alphaproteobacteria bacterium]|nr:bifunctional DNA primase/polymerase [Alphaproteobacteria bacterium]